MKAAIFGDIHGCAPALEEVLDAIELYGVDQIICTGDIIGALCWPEKTVQLVRENVDYCVYGNHDVYIRGDKPYTPIHEPQRIEHKIASEDLSDESVVWLNSLPAVETFDDVVIGHANPFSDNPSGFPADNYVDKRDWKHFASENIDGETVILGHTHIQGTMNLDKFDGLSGRIINPGPVGQLGTNPQFAVVDLDTDTVTLDSISFDYGETRDRLDELTNKYRNV